MKRSIIVALFVVSSTGALLLFTSRQADSETEPDIEAATDMPAALPISDFLAEFRADEAQANFKYLGKPVQLEAILNDVGSSEAGKFLLLTDQTTNEAVVKCMLVPGTMLEAGRFRKGDTILVQGFFEGKTKQLNIAFCTVTPNQNK